MKQNQSHIFICNFKMRPFRYGLIISSIISLLVGCVGVAPAVVRIDARECFKESPLSVVDRYSDCAFSVRQGDTLIINLMDDSVPKYFAVVPPQDRFERHQSYDLYSDFFAVGSIKPDEAVDRVFREYKEMWDKREIVLDISLATGIGIFEVDEEMIPVEVPLFSELGIYYLIFADNLETEYENTFFMQFEIHLE